MVAAQLDELAVAQQIGAAVADPEHRIMLLAHEQGDDGRAHLPAARRRPRRRSPSLARGSPPRPRRRLPRDPAGTSIRVQLLDQPRRGPFAALMAAHAVGDRPQAVALADAEAVLVLLRGPGPDGSAPSSRSGMARVHRGASAGRRSRASWIGTACMSPGRGRHLSTASALDKAANARTGRPFLPPRGLG